MSAKPPLEPLPPERWRKNLTDYNEGLGLVFERLMLNDFLELLQRKHNIQSVIEAPLYGMAGVSGINSVILARNGASVTLVDDNADRLEHIKRIWNELHLTANFFLQSPILQQAQDRFSNLQAPNNSFDLAWNWAALWYLPDAEKLIGELVRVSRNLIFIAMPNRAQIGYWMRKYVLEKEFVKYVDESWADIGRVKNVLRGLGCEIIDEGVLDVPPWPDTVMPATQVLQRLGIQSKKMQARFEGEGWNWSSMDYYLGKRPELKAQMDRYAFLERAPLPWQIKRIWAHHRYCVARVASLVGVL